MPSQWTAVEGFSVCKDLNSACTTLGPRPRRSRATPLRPTWVPAPETPAVNPSATTTSEPVRRCTPSPSSTVSTPTLAAAKRGCAGDTSAQTKGRARSRR